MYRSPFANSGEDAQRLREEGGRWLRDLRLKAGMTQLELSKRTELGYYTMVSSIERGVSRVPPDKYLAYAKALKVNPQFFMRNLLRYNDPYCYDILFGSEQ